MNKIKRALIGLGIISGTILLGSGYQYIDHKYGKHVHEQKPPITANKADISVSFVRIFDSYENYKNFKSVSYSDKDVKEASNDIISGKNGSVISSNYGNFDYFNKKDNAVFEGNGSYDVGSINYDFQSHYENNKFSTRVIVRKSLDNNKDDDLVNNSFLVNYSVPYINKTTIIKLPWGAGSESFLVVVFKINRI